MTLDALTNVKLWLLTKADADEERAEAIAPREPFLANLLRQDAKEARRLAGAVPQMPDEFLCTA